MQHGYVLATAWATAARVMYIEKSCCCTVASSGKVLSVPVVRSHVASLRLARLSGKVLFVPVARSRVTPLLKLNV